MARPVRPDLARECPYPYRSREAATPTTPSRPMGRTVLEPKPPLRRVLYERSSCKRPFLPSTSSGVTARNHATVIAFGRQRASISSAAGTAWASRLERGTWAGTARSATNAGEGSSDVRRGWKGHAPL